MVPEEERRERDAETREETGGGRLRDRREGDPDVGRERTGVDGPEESQVEGQ